MRKLRLPAVLLAAVLCLSGCGKQTPPSTGQISVPDSSSQQQTEPPRRTAPVYGTGFRNDPADRLTTAEAVRDMGHGITLGFTFEGSAKQPANSSVPDFETGWGSPRITQKMIRGYADAGFGVLRIPVAWMNLIQSDGTVHPELLDRVHRVTGWALNAGMYVILDMHPGSEWLSAFADPEKNAAGMQQYIRIWQQICSEFAGEGAHLLFASLDPDSCREIFRDNPAPENTSGMLLALSQAFVDTVRSSGGGNPRRHLLIAGYPGDQTGFFDPQFQMPEDPVSRCAVSVRYRAPEAFSLLEADGERIAARAEWGTAQDRTDMQADFGLLAGQFTTADVPVVIGECGCALQNKDPDSVRMYLAALCEEAAACGFCPVLWDMPGGLYDRQRCRLYDPLLQTMLLAPSAVQTTPAVPYARGNK